MGGVIRVLGLRRKVIERNLRLAYPDDKPENAETRARLIRQAYQHLGHLVFEVLMVLGPMEKFIRKYIDVRGFENWENAHAKGKGVIYLGSHVGSWEIMVATGGITGCELMMVTKHLKPEWLHRAIERGRAKYDVSGTYEPNTLRDVFSHIKKGRTVGFILDQYAGPPVGVRVPFFGVPVGTNAVVATLARRTGAAVVPVLNYRLPNGRVVVDVRPAVEYKHHANKNWEISMNTARYAHVLEGHVRAHPEQWLWSHRRFKGETGPLRVGEWQESRKGIR